jgi:hypothetical protein
MLVVSSVELQELPRTRAEFVSNGLFLPLTILQDLCPTNLKPKALKLTMTEMNRASMQF